MANRWVAAVRALVVVASLAGCVRSDVSAQRDPQFEACVREERSEGLGDTQTLDACVHAARMAAAEAQVGKVIESYVVALSARDRQALATLIPAENEVTTDIEAKLAAFGGRGIRDVSTAASYEFGDKVAKVHLSGHFEDGEKFSDELQLVREGDGKFTISMGENPDPQPWDRPPAETASPD